MKIINFKINLTMIGGNKNGFTLIELLVVISIIGILSTIAMTSFQSAREHARDAKRLGEMQQIKTALEIYRVTYNHYPYNTDNDCSGWDAGMIGGEGSGDTFIRPLFDTGIMVNVPSDPVGTGCGNTYRYYRYSAGSYGCLASEGAYYVIGVIDMESSGRPYPSSPGWSCPSRNWQGEFDWVYGSFEG